MGDSRPSWDEYFMRIAKEVATRATCPRRSVGAVIVLDRRILTTGYNGAPHGLAHCTEVGCKIVDGHCQRALHAEQNAILQAALNGVSTRGATVYVTCQPCNVCAKMIINAGIVRVVFEGDYPDPFAMELFEEAGMELVRLCDGVPEVISPERKGRGKGVGDASSLSHFPNSDDCCCADHAGGAGVRHPDGRD